MISITLPSLHPETLVSCLENLDASTSGRFEVIVVSPHEPRVGLRRGTLVWIDEQPDEARGISAAHEKAFTAARGDFVLAYADDHLLETGWDNDILVEFLQREHRNSPFCLGLRETPPHDDIQVSFGRYYANFPLMRRIDAHAVGGWLCGKFQVGFSDTDLSLRVWAADGRVEWSKTRKLRPTQQNARPVKTGHALRLREDEELLLHRWPDLAMLWTPNPDNPERHPGRDFNVGVHPGSLLFDESARSVYIPDPKDFWRLWRKFDEAQVQHIQPL